ncbi:MAG TPA: penicillin-binding transpeptidase domain-containing protein [Myxococcus sp.]|nr:penicillin-binding transpeptidase domain-containing protein [Myxococcus sp.]
MSQSPRFRHLRAGLLALTTLASAVCAASAPPAAKPAGHPGCFLLMDLETGQVTRNDAKRCAKRLPPASSFKVPHALIALETGVVKGVDEVRKWDGQKHEIEMWNQDQTLDTAMRRSALWFFQGTAKEIGRTRMEEWLKRFNYGTADASGDITRFWLGGPLRVSPDEQLAFLARLYRNELPVRPEVAEAVKGTLVQGPDTVASTRDGINMGGPWKAGAVLSAKTGTIPLKEGDVTWLVGHVASPRGRHVFVSAVQSPPGKRPQPHPALAHAIEALKAHGLL